MFSDRIACKFSLLLPETNHSISNKTHSPRALLRNQYYNKNTLLILFIKITKKEHNSFNGIIVQFLEHSSDYK